MFRLTILIIWYATLTSSCQVMTSTWGPVLKLTFLGQPIIQSTRLSERKTIPVNSTLYKDGVNSYWRKCPQNFLFYDAVCIIASFPVLWGSNGWPEVKIVVRFWKELSISYRLFFLRISRSFGCWLTRSETQAQSESHTFWLLVTFSDLRNDLSEKWNLFIKVYS